MSVLADARVRRALYQVLRAFDNKRFTLDQFAQTWYAKTGATSLDLCHRALKEMEDAGDVLKIGLMHWRSIAPVKPSREENTR